jgi:hypothetical protein
VQVTATDEDGDTTPAPAAQAVTITPGAMETAPGDPTKTALAVGGTLGNDVIILTPADATGSNLTVQNG